MKPKSGRKLIALISTEDKSKEQIKNEVVAAFNKYKKAKETKNV